MEVNDIIKPENLVYQKSRLMAEKQFNFCPGCGHGVVVRTNNWAFCTKML